MNLRPPVVVVGEVAGFFPTLEQAVRSTGVALAVLLR